MDFHMPLKAGLRYITRCGKLTAPLVTVDSSDADGDYLSDPSGGFLYGVSGPFNWRVMRCLDCEQSREWAICECRHDHDIVAPYDVADSQHGIEAILSRLSA